ncbi:SRPBCC family protein [Deinococcus oregonensis]|uniref:SRPBCC family protein n=1 Tax=Deinococcus oregonensis TaxID=1805970 RepID=A0ABV6ATJ3_9DEIO
MPTAEVHEHIDCPPQDVFAYVTDPHRLPEWLNTVLEVQEVRPATFEQPGQYISVSRFLGRRFNLTFRTVLGAQPLTILAETSAGPVPHSWHYTFTPEGSGTRIKLIIEAEPTSFFSLAAPLALNLLQRQVQTDLHTVKHLLEAARMASASPV